MKKFILSFLVLAVLFPAAARGQSHPVAVGARVRVTSPADQLDKHVSTVTEVRGDSMVVVGRAGSRTIAMRNVTALDISTGTRNRVVRDGLIGLGAGALIGGIAGAASHEDCNDDVFCIVPVSSSGWAVAGAAVFGAAGFAVGALIGVFDKTDRWEPRAPLIAVSISPSRAGGATVMISRAF